MSETVLALLVRKDKEEADKQTEGGWEMPQLVRMSVKYERKVICNER